MQDDCILVALGLPQLKVISSQEFNNRFEITVMYRTSEAKCPRCGQVSNKVQDRRIQSKQDRGIRDKPVYLELIKRRFRCLWCCKVWTEPDDVFGSRRRSSRRFREYLGEEALHQTVKRVAQKEQVGEGLVRRCVTETMHAMLQAKGVSEVPGYIGVDEFSVGRRLYHTAICNLVKSEVMEVVEGQGSSNLQKYLETFPEPDVVKAVAMDMHQPFRDAVELCLPMAKVVVDKFHFIRQVNGMVDAVRTRLQGGRRSKSGELYRRRYTLLKGAEKLKPWEKVKLNQLFLLYPELEKVWQVKEDFRNWYKQGNRRQAENASKVIEGKMADDKVPEYDDLRYILSEWRDEILNYFDCPITNGFVEGKNNRIKTLKRMAYGYRNMANFHLRILATNYKGTEAISHLLT